MKPLTSIIILNHNGKEHLQESITSVFQQTYKGFEVILVDNASTDSSVDFVRKSFPKVRIIQNNKNLGFAEGNNIGIRASNGNIIVLLNNDTKVDKNWLKELISPLDVSKKIGMTSPKILFYNKKINSIGLELYKDGYAKDIGINEEDKNQYREQEVFGPSGCSAAYLKELLEDIKIGDDYFDSDFFAYYEDLDLACRARLKGWKCFYISTSIVYHKLGSTAKKMNNLGVSLGIKNKIFYILKNYPLKILIKQSPKILIRQLISTLYYLISLNPSALKARASIFINIPKMLRKRYLIQKEKTENITPWLKNRPLLQSLFSNK